jgi:BolA protein
MILTAEALHQQLMSQLAPRHLEVIDESAAHAGHAGSNGLGSGTHFRVLIGDPSFNQLTRVARHRLVYDALGEAMAQGLHALAIEIVNFE